MIEHKYGEFSDSQFADYKKKMHSMVHWLLIYAEENNPTIGSYYTTVQSKFNGFNSLLSHPNGMVEIMSLIEAARLEYFGNYHHDKYRKLILDAHELIDKLG